MYTTASIFFKTLAEAGITHVFVNWGSDHPALLEELERQRVEDGATSPKIITSPNEMVALSAAQGYAQVMGKPAAVIVHVDVGTQAMAGAIHNVDRGQTPVLIYAGASPFSNDKSVKGYRNEWIMWLQDIPDQAAIVRQYMRYTAQINSSQTIVPTIRRSLQFAMSKPRGPVYLWARREVMEQEIDGSLLEGPLSESPKWPVVEPTALSNTNATRIATALLTAHMPLIITSHIGRNAHAVATLLALSTLLAVPIFCTCPSAVNVPFSHPYFAGLSYLQPGTHTPLLDVADVIVVIDSDLPWIPANALPSADARVFVLDSGDPLKKNIGLWSVDAELICHADAETALQQIIEQVREIDGHGNSAGESVLGGPTLRERGQRLAAQHKNLIRRLEAAEKEYPNAADGTNSAHIAVPNILGILRNAVAAGTPSRGMETLYLNEGISNYPLVWSHLQPIVPGSVLTSGGSSLGWALGAAVGAYLGGEVAGAESGEGGYDLIVVIVGDGSFLFGVPSSAYWMARKYNTPFLTIVLNNGGWKSPKLSMLGVHPDGLGSKAPGERLSVGFGPDSPDFAQIAVAASGGWAWGKRVGVGEYVTPTSLKEVVTEAVEVVVKQRRCAVLDCVLESI